ncbi:EndoU domain-containing protein [Leptotrichia sp. OH3620_COT-345]|uniref:EndoU domain-containing protein n=1 Tax=Leptotrichia sp. OH3620_COT-345 TaxID=2491048 RepID=UPI0018F50E60|nr:EndoU domain-containing protein [Leptotrichia sp. OH3620_COT-345]
MSKLTDEDRARLNRYSNKDMQFKDLIGVDFRYENKFNVNIGKQGKIASEKSLRKISKYENVEKKALAAKRKGKSHKEVEKIYKEGVKKIKEDELYEKDKVMSSEEKAFYEHVMKNGNVFTYKMKVITSEGKYYLVNERIINEEADSRGAVSDRELPLVKITLEEFRKDVLNGQVVYVPGLFVTGYGIRKIDAQANKDIKNDMLLNGLIQTGTGVMRAKIGGTSVALGGMLCYGGACFIGAQMMGSGLGVGGMGLNETYVGLQNVGYALSTDSGLKKGKAIEEFTRVQKHNDSLTSNAIKIRNPILDYIVNHGGTEADYNHINAMTGVMSAELNTYNNYYKNNGIVDYVVKERARRAEYKSPTFTTPDRYYNIKAENGLLSYISQKAVVKNYGDIIKSDYLIKNPNYVYQKNTEVAKFDFKHIIEGEITKNGKGTAGGHKVGENVRVTRIFKIPDKNGAYQAKVEIYDPLKDIWKGKRAKTTMFPDDWSVDKIKWEVQGAWNSSDFEIINPIKKIGKEHLQAE